MEKDIQLLFSLIHIHINSLDDLPGTMIPRETLLSEDSYYSIKENIDNFKKYFSSSSMTSLHMNAEERQKWPLINLLRQILKANNFAMVPIRKANGYDKNKKKLFKRFFKIEKI